MDSRVLIPRPETELLVDLIVQKKKKFSSIVDVGTGSGVILLTLLAEGVAPRGIGLDLSEEALTVARGNAANLRIPEASFLISDRLAKLDERVSLIVSNPPYIKTVSHRAGVHGMVDTHEPPLALYIPDQDYETWFRDFFGQVSEKLEAGGEFYMEGHEAELATQADWLREAGLKDVSVVQDWTKRNRFLFARKG